jgi:hypothetical protein
MLTFTQTGGKLISGGYIINSKLLNENMGLPIGLHNETQDGGGVKKESTLHGKVRGILNSQIFDYFTDKKKKTILKIRTEKRKRKNKRLNKTEKRKRKRKSA